MLGDPGTAKSQLLKFVEKCSPIGVSAWDTPLCSAAALGRQAVDRATQCLGLPRRTSSPESLPCASWLRSGQHRVEEGD